MWSFQPDEFTHQDIFGGRGSDESLVSHHDAYRLCDVLASLPALVRHQDSKPRGGGAQLSGTTPVEHTSPWLAQLQQHVSSTSSKSSVNVASATEELSMLSDEDGEEHASPFKQKLDELDRQRQEDVVPPWPEHFTTHLLGGTWQLERTGREVYGYRVDAKKSSFVAFVFKVLQSHGMRLSAAFEQHKFGESGSALCADLWCHHALALATAFVNASEQGMPPESSIDFDAARYRETMLPRIPPQGRQRVEQIITMRPEGS
eukprot:2135982-Amphidinium_carterae.1